MLQEAALEKAKRPKKKKKKRESQEQSPACLDSDSPWAPVAWGWERCLDPFDRIEQGPSAGTPEERWRPCVDWLQSSGLRQLRAGVELSGSLCCLWASAPSSSLCHPVSLLLTATPLASLGPHGILSSSVPLGAYPASAPFLHSHSPRRRSNRHPSPFPANHRDCRLVALGSGTHP